VGQVRGEQLLSHKLRVEESDLGSPAIPLGGSQRIEHWEFYARGVLESPRSFLVGHATPPDRIQHPSAHNYWLDALYNFGMFATLPLVVLLFWTGHAIWGRRHDIMVNPLLIGTSMAVAYLLLVENMLKVGMRQPYPGIITFFIWGLLIARLRTIGGRATSSVIQE
jgi:hypothetical protein